jgi:uncharacterized surface protein with fasciclin (FAS1) repeats
MPIRSKAAATAALAAIMTAAPAVPALAEAAPADDPNIVEVVLDVSGDAGFDHRSDDYDLLREALVAAGLVDAVANTDGITVFAPNDRAFIRLARDLGFDGWGEAAAFAFLAEATGFESAENPGLLDDVLLYHVAPGLIRSGDLADGPIQTLLGETFTPDGLNLIDNDPNANDPQVRTPFDLEASNGVIHTIDRVLRPVDLAPAAPGSAVELVVAVSGDAGFDGDRWDFDLLREALAATGLVDAVANAGDVTVFAPNDRAFIRLARDLGYGGSDEAGAFAFLAEATGFESAENPGLLDDVLLYHVAPGARTLAELHGSSVETLLGSGVTVEGRRVVDGDPNAANAWIRKQSDIVVGDGIVHTISRVLRPIDL